MHLSELARRLCSQDLYPFFLSNRKKIVWMVQNGKAYDHSPGNDEVVKSGSFRAVWSYIEHYKGLPKSPSSVKGYVINNPDHLKEFSRGGEGGKDTVTAVIDELEALEAWTCPVDTIKELDTIVLLDTAFTAIRGQWHSTLYALATKIANGDEAFKMRIGGEMVEERGPAASQRWLRMQWLRDFTDEAPPVDGFLHENTQAVREGFARLMSDQTSQRRMLLGLEHIDRNIVVGRDTDIKFIGIVGQANDGKTSLMNHIIYTWLKQGFNGVYISFEHNGESIWNTMTYLHSSHPDYAGRILPPKALWVDRAVSPEDIKHMKDITHDIETRRNLTGKLEVKEFQDRDWETIAEWLRTYHDKNQYDFLALDYITRLEMPGDQRFFDNNMKQIIHRIQKLTRTFDSMRGLVIVSPVQITKESYAKAMEKDFKEGEGHYNLNALRTYSELKDDMDLVLTVWSDTEMKDISRCEVEVACIKRRVGPQPPAATMVIHPNTGAFTRKGTEAITGRAPLTPQLERGISEIHNLDNNTGMADEMPAY